MSGSAAVEVRQRDTRALDLARLSLARRRVAQQTWQSPRSPCHGRRIVRGLINYGADETWWRWDVSEMTALERREGRVTRRHLEGSSGRARSLHTSAAVSVKPFMSRTAAIYVSNAGAAGQCQGDTYNAASFTV